MDVEKLIQAEERVISGDTIKRSVRNGKLAREKADLIILMRDHYEALLAAERSKVIAEVREWVEDTKNIYGDCYGSDVVSAREMLEKLDSMEQEAANA